MKGCFLFVSLVFCWSRSMNVRVMDTWDLEKKGVIHHSSCFSLSQMPMAMYSKWRSPGLPSWWRGSDSSTRFFFGWTTLWKNPPIKLRYPVWKKGTFESMIFPTSPGGIYEFIGEKALCSWKMLGDDPFLLAGGPQKAVSFRDPGTPLGGGEVGGGVFFSKMTWNLYVRNI